MLTIGIKKETFANATSENFERLLTELGKPGKGNYSGVCVCVCVCVCADLRCTLRLVNSKVHL